jgi:hypothetical protein
MQSGMIMGAGYLFFLSKAAQEPQHLCGTYPPTERAEEAF